MNHDTLRVLFEWLCDHLEDDSGPYHFHFQGGFGVEYPQGVVMVFVFQTMTIVFRIPAQDAHTHGLDPADEKEAVSADECLEMSQQLKDFTGGFQDLFGGSSLE